MVDDKDKRLEMKSPKEVIHTSQTAFEKAKPADEISCIATRTCAIIFLPLFDDFR